MLSPHDAGYISHVLLIGPHMPSSEVAQYSPLAHCVSAVHESPELLPPSVAEVELGESLLHAATKSTVTLARRRRKVKGWWVFMGVRCSVRVCNERASSKASPSRPYSWFTHPTYASAHLRQPYPPRRGPRARRRGDP